MNTHYKKQMIQPTPYSDINQILNEVLTGAQAILGEHFVGMALDGSLATGDFNVDTSDLDFVVATAVSPTNEQFEHLKAMHGRIGRIKSKWALELEGAYIPLSALRRYKPDNATHPYIDRGASNLRWEHLAVDWIIHYHVLHTAGITVAGPSIQSLIDPIPKTELQQAVDDLMQIWWLPMLDDAAKLKHGGYRAYAIMTMCRMLYTAQLGAVVSKPQAARWLLAGQNSRWQSLVEEALSWQGGDLDVPVTAVQDFIQFTWQSLASPIGRNEGT